MARADIKLGYGCNDQCVHCVVDDFRDVLRAKGMRQNKTTQQYREELLASRARCDVVVFTGGEPTIRNDLVPLLEYAHSLGYRVSLQSNGRRFSDPEFSDRVCATGSIVYCIALHGPTASVHEAITRTRGSFAETVAGLRNLVQRGQVLTGKIVLSKLNYAVLPQTAQLLLDLGVRHLSIAFPHALGRARKLWDEVVPRYTATLGYLYEALSLVVRAGATAEAETFTYCHMEGYERFISEIHQQLEDHVELRQYGDATEVADWSRVRPAIKRKFPQCKSCRFDAICEGPWLEYAERYGGDEFQPRRGRRVRDVRQILDGSFRREYSFMDALPRSFG